MKLTWLCFWIYFSIESKSNTIEVLSGEIICNNMVCKDKTFICPKTTDQCVVNCVGKCDGVNVYSAAETTIVRCANSQSCTNFNLYCGEIFPANTLGIGSSEMDGVVDECIMRCVTSGSCSNSKIACIGNVVDCDLISVNAGSISNQEMYCDLNNPGNSECDIDCGVNNNGCSNVNVNCVSNNCQCERTSCNIDIFTPEPTISPSLTPTKFPSNNPTKIPTSQPTVIPSVSPTKPPSITPTSNPSISPTLNPVLSPTMATNIPSVSPTNLPTLTPSNIPSKNPIKNPTESPSFTDPPTTTPSILPTISPTKTTNIPSRSPTESPNETDKPTETPTNNPTVTPSNIPTTAPSNVPTSSPNVYITTDIDKRTTTNSATLTSVNTTANLTNISPDIDGGNNVNSNDTGNTAKSRNQKIIVALIIIMILLLCVLVIVFISVYYIRSKNRSKQDSLRLESEVHSKSEATTPGNIYAKEEYIQNGVKNVSYYIDNVNHQNSEELNGVPATDTGVINGEDVDINELLDLDTNAVIPNNNGEGMGTYEVYNNNVTPGGPMNDIMGPDQYNNNNDYDAYMNNENSNNYNNNNNDIIQGNGHTKGDTLMNDMVYVVNEINKQDLQKHDEQQLRDDKDKVFGQILKDNQLQQNMLQDNIIQEMDNI